MICHGARHGTWLSQWPSNTIPARVCVWEGVDVPQCQLGATKDRRQAGEEVNLLSIPQQPQHNVAARHGVSV